MAYLDSFGHKEGYSNQVEIPGIASIIHEDVISQATWGNHCELSSTIVMAVYNDVVNSKGMVRFGTRVSDFAIEWGTAVEFYNGNCKYLIPVRISDTKFGIVYVQTSDDDGYIVCGTVSGTIPTLGTTKEFKDASTTIPIGAVLWDTEKVLIAYANTTTNGQCILATTTDINSVTLGAEATFVATTDITAYPTLTQLCKHSANLATVAYRASASLTEVVTLSLAGTTITPNTAGKAQFGYAGGGVADVRYPSIGALSATKLVVAYTDVTDTNKGNAQIGDISGTTISMAGTEYNFDAAGLATRIPKIAIIASNLFAVVYSPTANAIYARIGSVATTVITWGTVKQLSDGNAYEYPRCTSGTPINITFTKSGQLTISYLTSALSQFICGMLTYNYTIVDYTPMCYKVAEAGTGEQIELSSVYLKANGLGFVSGTGLYSDKAGCLYLNGTLASNKFYSTSDEKTAATTTLLEVKRVGMANEPIILKENQALYASIDVTQDTLPAKGSCTVFGLKRSA